MKDPYFQSRYKFDSSREVVWKEIVRYLRPFIREDSVVVDLGAGYCNFINAVRAKIKYAVDISPDFQKFANPDVKTFVSSVSDLDFLTDESVDVAHASNLLEHFDDHDLVGVISEFGRILKKDGLLILLQPNFRYTYKNYFDDYTHKKIFTDEGLKNFLISHGFEIIHRKNKFLPFSVGSLPLPGPIWLARLLIRGYMLSPGKPRAGQMLL